MKYDSLGDRMKGYENISRFYLTRRSPVIIRVDGKAFHTFTRGLKRPFDDILRIQTFPDNYQFILKATDGNVAVSASDAYKIIGNAVPCVLAYNIAKNIEGKWKSYFREK